MYGGDTGDDGDNGETDDGDPSEDGDNNNGNGDKAAVTDGKARRSYEAPDQQTFRRCGLD